MYFLSVAFAQGAESVASGPPPEPGFMAFLPFILMFVVFWFFLIRPQQKKLKEQQEMQDKLEKGVEVVTNAGIFGRITGVADKVVTLEIANNVRIKILKSQISSAVKGDMAAGSS